MKTSFRRISILCLAVLMASFFVMQAQAVPARPPKNQKMDLNKDHKIDGFEKHKAQKTWNQNHKGCQAGECGPKGPKGNGPNHPGCKPGDQKCIQHWKSTHPKQGQQKCHPKDKKCIERYKKFKRSQTTPGTWEENADVNDDGQVGKKEMHKYKKDMKDGTYDGPPSEGDGESAEEIIEDAEVEAPLL